MLKDGVVLAVILLIVVGGGFLWWTNSAVQPIGTVADPQLLQPQPAAAPAHVVVKAAPKPKLPDGPVPEITGFDPRVVSATPVGATPATATPVADATPATATATAAPVTATSVVRRDSRPFPAVDQIPRGARGDSITGKYGDPTVSTVTSTGGHVVETMVYARQSGRNATVIRIEDGKVSSAYSQVQPVAPPGLSAPRPVHNE